MVGLFTFMSIGAAVLYDLWEILDIKKGHTMVSRSQRSLRIEVLRTGLL
jgi:dolichyl-phosphate-mannose--protein O-mannosyl transferase